MPDWRSQHFYLTQTYPLPNLFFNTRPEPARYWKKTLPLGPAGKERLQDHTLPWILVCDFSFWYGKLAGRHLHIPRFYIHFQNRSWALFLSSWQIDKTSVSSDRHLTRTCLPQDYKREYIQTYSNPCLHQALQTKGWWSNTTVYGDLE